MDPQRQAMHAAKSRWTLLAHAAAVSHIVDDVPAGFAKDFPSMPTLFRFLFILGVIAGIIYGSMLALVFLVEPRERDVTVRIPSERLNPAPQE